MGLKLSVPFKTLLIFQPFVKISIRTPWSTQMDVSCLISLSTSTSYDAPSSVTTMQLINKKNNC